MVGWNRKVPLYTELSSFQGIGTEKGSTVFIFPAADIFALNSTPGNVEKELSIHASFFEIYGGKVFDLMNNKAKLRILEDGKQQVQIVGLAEEKVENVKDVLKLIQIGNSCRFGLFFSLCTPLTLMVETTQYPLQ